MLTNNNSNNYLNNNSAAVAADIDAHLFHHHHGPDGMMMDGDNDGIETRPPPEKKKKKLFDRFILTKRSPTKSRDQPTQQHVSPTISKLERTSPSSFIAKTFLPSLPPLKSLLNGSHAVTAIESSDNSNSSNIINSNSKCSAMDGVQYNYQQQQLNNQHPYNFQHRQHQNSFYSSTSTDGISTTQSNGSSSSSLTSPSPVSIGNHSTASSAIIYLRNSTPSDLIYPNYATQYSEMNHKQSRLSLESSASSSSNQSSTSGHGARAVYAKSDFISPRVHPIAMNQHHPRLPTSLRSPIPHDSLIYHGKSLRNHPVAAYQQAAMPRINFKKGSYDSKNFCQKFRKEYVLERKLGEGGFGFVFECRRKQDGIRVACKFIMKQKLPFSYYTLEPKLRTRIPFEIYILQYVKHPNVIRFIDWFEDQQYFYLITELHGKQWNADRVTSITDGSCFDLFECISSHGRLEEHISKHIFQQVVNAISYLHCQLNVCHRDVKDENILVDGNYQVKLIDFGSAAWIPIENDYKNYYKQYAGTKQYCPPEILHGRSYRGPEAEIWGLGVLLYNMLIGENPFNVEANILTPSPVVDALLVKSHQIIYVGGRMVTPSVYLDDLSLLSSSLSVNNKHQSSQGRRTIRLSEQVVDLLRGLLEPDPIQRMRIDDILRHEWLLNP